MSGSLVDVAAIYSSVDVAAGVQQPRLRVSVNRQQVDDTSLPLSSGDEVPTVNLYRRVMMPCLQSCCARAVLQLSCVSTDANLLILMLDLFHDGVACFMALSQRRWLYLIRLALRVLTPAAQHQTVMLGGVLGWSITEL